MTQFETTVLSKVGVLPQGSLADAVAGRRNIFEMSQSAEEAVLRPKDYGAFGHDLRAALAARVARQAGQGALADHYAADAGDKVPLADPDNSEADLEHILSFVDKVANRTRDIVAEDVEDLRAAGVSDADIVRLCELVAFLAYQCRVIAGLRLMQGTTP
ncbi:hypothetical protein ACOTTU_05575 [Roseobacter sp. EG26]|uniref:hypothetical protein n=1 Tax=Roseobacter sp. EG26 TaxID=3412477 RepID=UPI003CE44D38